VNKRVVQLGKSGLEKYSSYSTLINFYFGLNISYTLRSNVIKFMKKGVPTELYDVRSICIGGFYPKVIGVRRSS
jgi:hypothetical protein